MKQLLIKKSFKYCVMLLFSFSITTAPLQQLQNLEKEFTAHVYEKNDMYGKTVQKAFKSFHASIKTSGPISLMHNPHIQNLFLLDPQKSLDTIFNQNLKNSQNLMLIYLYAKIFHEYISQAQTIIEELCDAQDYWQTEMFYDQLPTFRKHPVYWYHSPAHKKMVKSRVHGLKITIHQATLMLGMTLHGRYQFSQIQDHSNLSEILATTIHPFMQTLHIFKVENESFAKNMLQDALTVHQALLATLQNCKKTLTAHNRPSHIVRHGFLYGCIAASVISTYALCKKHEEEISGYQQKTLEAWNYFLKEYIQLPAENIKDALWEQKNIGLKRIKKPKGLTPDSSWKTWIIDDRLNQLFIWINELTGKLIDGGNENMEVIEKTLQQQQLTMAIAAISPVIIGTYATHKLTNHTYNKYIKHESWYRPMQLIVREMDKTLNRLTSQPEISYADNGMMHILTLRLKTYISCLPNEELQLIMQDLQELSAYHLSYQQKRGVLDRMHKTYEFLN